MSHGGTRNEIQETVGKFRLDLPRILPEFERTDERTTHHWRDAIEHRRMMRKGKRIRTYQMAQTGAALFAEFLSKRQSDRF